MQSANRHPWWLSAVVLAALVLLYSLTPATVTHATVPNRQTWTYVPGDCAPALQGAVFSTGGSGCGGSGTTFDSNRIYAHNILQDVATTAAPCAGVATGAACYRMWYTGIASDDVRRIGYATSPDGRVWTRVPGAAAGGAVLGAGAPGSFDSFQVSFPGVVKDGGVFRMWYTGYDNSVFSLGYATSTDGVTWTRVAGPLAGGAVLRPSGVNGTFDRDLVAAPRPIIDQASASAPCEAGRTSGTCFRMWYEGMLDSGGQVFRTGHAVSPDGLAWTRVASGDSTGAILGLGPSGDFDSNFTGAPSVIKDGAIYRMWYDAKDGFETYRIGHVVSTDGVNWVRPNPNTAVLQGSDDPATFSPDSVWSPTVVKDGSTYRLWYATGDGGNSLRFGYATMTQGAALGGLSLSRSATTYTISFTTASDIPATGSLLITLPPNVGFSGTTAGALTGFGAGATLVADPAAVTDAASLGIARGSLVIRLPNGATPGPKTVSFSLASLPTAAAPLLVQTFDQRGVLEYGSVDLASAGTVTPTPAPTNTATPLPTSTPTLTNTPLPVGDQTNRQLWTQVGGTCAAGVQGAVFSLPATGCGGAGTTFDASQIYPPMVIKDTASAAQPCAGIASGATCYRMWYVGNDIASVRRIGYATSPDGRTWTRVVGPGAGGSVLSPGAGGSFDSQGVTTLSVIEDAGVFRMWYSGIGASGEVEGIGYATSTDGVSWTRVTGPLAGGAVLRGSGVGGTFDSFQVVAPTVIRDQASALLPCEAGRTSGTCFRMWYEGGPSSGGPFAIGYAVSPDGVSWTRVSGGAGSGAVLGNGPSGTFDENGVGVPSVIKDGALLRMWYEARDFSVPDRYVLGSVVSTDGISWSRPSPNTPVFQGSDDAGTFSPDNVWAPRLIKDGIVYRLWYTVSSRPSAVRFGYATMVPGAALGALSLTSSSGSYTLSFQTAANIPAGGSVLLTLPASLPFGQVSAGALTGFGAGATLTADPAAVSDAPGEGATRGALLIRLPNGAAPGPKTVTFGISGAPAAPATLLVQTFDARQVLEFGAVDLLNGAVGTPTPTSAATSTATNTALPNTATNTPTSTATNTATSTATNTPTASITPAPSANNALSFDGLLDEVRGPQIPGTDGTQTIEAWVRPNTNLQSGVIVATGDLLNGWALEIVNGRATWLVSTNTGWRTVRNTNVTLVANTWYHVAATYSGGTARVYVNGNRGAATSVGTLRLGPYLRVGGAVGFPYLNGQIDEVRLSNIVRYTAAFTRPSTGFIADANTLALYRFNEGSGQTVADSSGNGRNLTLGSSSGSDLADPSWVTSTAPISVAPTATPTNTPTRTPTFTPTNTPTAGPSPTATNVPPANNALSFDGSNDEVRGPQIPGTSGTQTVELWVRPTTNLQNAVLVATSDDASGWSLEINNGRATWWVATTTGWRSVTNANVTLVANTWYHVAATYSGGTARVYVDGNQGAAVSVGTLTLGPNVRVGGMPGFDFTTGQIDEVRLSNIVRYAAAFTRPSTAFVPDASTLALYRFNEGSGQAAADSSGNGRNLTLGTSAGADSADPVWVSSTAPFTQ